MQGLYSYAKHVTSTAEPAAGEYVLDEVVPFGPAEREATWAKLKAQSELVKAVRGGRSAFEWLGPNDSVSVGTAQTNVAQLSERQEVKPADVLRAVLKRRGEKVEALENKLIEACLNCGRDGNAQHDSDNTCSSCSPWPAKYDWKTMPASMPISWEDAARLHAAGVRGSEEFERKYAERLGEIERDLYQDAPTVAELDREWASRDGAQAKFMRELGEGRYDKALQTFADDLNAQEAERGRTLEPRVAAALTMEPQAFSRRVWSLQEE